MISPPLLKGWAINESRLIGATQQVAIAEVLHLVQADGELLKCGRHDIRNQPSAILECIVSKEFGTFFYIFDSGRKES